jgi:ATP phosphoribosyltransferase-like protein
MRSPTVSTLHHGAGHSVTIAVETDKVPTLIPQIKAAGGTDIVVSAVRMLVP